MQPTVTVRVARRVGRLVRHTIESYKMAEAIEMLFGIWTLDGPKKPRVGWWGRDPHAWGHNCKWSIYSKQLSSGICLAVDILKATLQVTEPVWCGCQLRCTTVDGSAHWHNLANTTEPPVCGGDAALYLIILTTCYLWESQLSPE